MKGLAIGVEIGGSHVEVGLVCGDSLVFSQTLEVSSSCFHQVLPKIEAAIPEVAGRGGFELNQVSGIAVGICGVVGDGGRLTATNGKYDDGLGFSFEAWGKRCFSLPCKAQNDTCMALLGERYAGAARGVRDVVLITLGTGIGSAVLLSGELLYSDGKMAGGLAGHIGVDWKGRLCSCGNRGCAEAEASTAVLDTLCREHELFEQSSLRETDKAIDFRMLSEAADAHDPLAVSILDRCLGVWSALAVSLIHAYDPTVLIFGGGVMRRQETLLPKIRAHVDRHAWKPKGTVRIVPAMLGSSAAMLGAIPLLEMGGAA